MQITHIVFGFGLGGIETMLANITNEQVKYGHEVHIVVINNIIDNSLKDALNKEIRFHCLNRKVGSKSPLPVVRLNLLLSELKPDVIHLHNSSIAKYIVFRKLKERLCVTQHDVRYRNNEKYLYKSKRIYAISNIVKDDIWNNVHLVSEVVTNGINPDLIENSSHNPDDKFRIVQVSRLFHQKKGQHILIKAVHRLVEKGYKNISVDFIGDGESLDYLRKLTEDSGLQENINFLGAKEQSYVFGHLHDYDLFVQPSIFEGFGLTVTEAMAAKVPVLVSENQGPLEIIDNGRYGYSFKNQNVNDCAGKIEIFLRGMNDKSMIEKAYQRVLNVYNVRVTARTYLEKYQEFIQSGYAQIH